MDDRLKCKIQKYKTSRGENLGDLRFYIYFLGATTRHSL